VACSEYVVKITFFCGSMFVASFVSGWGVEEGDGIT